MDGEAELGEASHELLAALRAYGARYGRGAALPLVGTTEQCEREIEVEEEVEVRADSRRMSGSSSLLAVFASCASEAIMRLRTGRIPRCAPAADTCSCIV